MLVAGKLCGSLNEYNGRIELYDAVNKKDVIFNSKDEMFNYFYSLYENLNQFMDLLFVYGLDDNTYFLFDKRTVEFYEAYSFYKSNPDKAYKHVYYFWFKIYNTINNIMINNQMRSSWL